MAVAPTISACLDAIAARLTAQLPGVPVQRGRRSAISPEATLPRLVVRMGPWSEQEDESFGLTLIRAEAMIEGYTRAPLNATDPDKALEDAMADLHARCQAALAGQELAIGIAGDSIMPEGERFEPDAPLIELAADAVGGFTWIVSFQFRAAIGTGPYTTTT